MNSDYMRNDEYGSILCFVTNSIPQFICFFITGLFSSTGLFSRPSFRPSRNFLRVSSRCACLKKSSSVSPSIRILSFAFENTKMIGIINLVHMYFMNIRYSFCSLTLLRKNKVRLLEIYTPAQIICFYTFISLSTSSFIFSGLVSAIVVQISSRKTSILLLRSLHPFSTQTPPLAAEFHPTLLYPCQELFVVSIPISDLIENSRGDSNIVQRYPSSVG